MLKKWKKESFIEKFLERQDDEFFLQLDENFKTSFFHLSTENCQSHVFLRSSDMLMSFFAPNGLEKGPSNLFLLLLQQHFQ